METWQEALFLPDMRLICFKIIKLHDGQDLIVLILDVCMCVFMYVRCQMDASCLSGQ